MAGQGSQDSVGTGTGSVRNLSPNPQFPLLSTQGNLHGGGPGHVSSSKPGGHETSPNVVGTSEDSTTNPIPLVENGDMGIQGNTPDRLARIETLMDRLLSTLASREGPVCDGEIPTQYTMKHGDLGIPPSRVLPGVIKRGSDIGRKEDLTKSVRFEREKGQFITQYSQWAYYRTSSAVGHYRLW